MLGSFPIADLIFRQILSPVSRAQKVPTKAIWAKQVASNVLMEPPQLQQDQRRSTIAEVSKTHKDIATTSFIFLPPKLMHSFFWPSCLSLFSKLLPSKRSFVFLDFTYLTFDVFLLLLLLLFLLFFFFFLCCCCFFLFVCLLLGPPVVTVFEPNPTNATENQATQFECYGTGLPLPTFSIKKLVPPPGIKRYATL